MPVHKIARDAQPRPAALVRLPSPAQLTGCLAAFATIAGAEERTRPVSRNSALATTKSPAARRSPTGSQNAEAEPALPAGTGGHDDDY